MRFSLDKYQVERKPLEARTMVLTLPVLPPSTNNLYANAPGKGRVKSRAYEDWISQCGLLLNGQIKGRFNSRVDILIEAEDRHPTRDSSNFVKPIEDLLVRCGIISDDRAKFVRSIKGAWAPIVGVRIEIARAT